ncbi:peptidylprolyl isomerase [Patiriisocius hiemis]|uniref:Peptidyl-prolyl cis-trans isomerase n=1 Tax=Patiriisocius hiemis TaxID=3075604 RepID=A0ABU2YEI0_9FLAO|nr:peptidylprolyl isomerase [Constantimarinum sp. W242]MDT0556591.1 peptidylprolyl isomerase [Constantimarinum sp. W242]
MKTFYLFFVLSLIFFASCEDTKKEKKITTESTSEKIKDSISSEANKGTNNQPVFEKITSDNVESFLTQYEKNNPENKVKIITQHGNIEIELYEDTPLHRANFIYLVKQGYFDKTFFHRVVPNFIIQGGNSDNADTNKKRFKIGNEYLIPAEITRNHTYGSVSGAKQYRENPDKQTMPFEFFIFLGPQTSTSHLNGNYTVFAKVTKGMDVVEKIANLPRDEGEWPLRNVKIKTEIIN